MNKISNIIKNKYFKYVIIFFIIIILVFIRLIFLNSDKKLTSFNESSSDIVTVLSNNKVISDNIIGGVMENSAVYSFDNSKYVFSVYVNGENNSYCSLYITSGNKVKTVSENAKSDFLITPDGSFVVYLDSMSKLSIYSFSSGTSKTIAQKADKFAVSPDGKTVIYTSFDDSGLSYILYMYNKNKTTELSTGLIPAAVSNKGTTVYATDSFGTILYKINTVNGEKTKIADKINGKIYFNSKLTQFSISNNNNTYFYYNDSSVKLLIKDINAYPVCKNKLSLSTANNCYILNCKNLTDKYYVTDKSKDSNKFSLFYIDKNGGNTELTKECDDYSINENKSEIKFTAQNKLYAGKKSNIKIIAENVKTFNCNKNKTVYCDLQNNLHYSDKNNIISSDIKEYTVTASGYIYFTLNNNKSLYVTKNGRTLKTISENVAAFNQNSNKEYIFYYENNEDGTYSKYSSLNSDFRCIAENLKSYY